MVRTDRPKNMIKSGLTGEYIINPSDINPVVYSEWDSGAGRDAKEYKMHGEIKADKARFNCTWKGITLLDKLKLQRELRGPGGSEKTFFIIEFDDIKGTSWDGVSTTIPTVEYEVYQGDMEMAFQKWDEGTGQYILDYTTQLVER